MVQPRPTTPQEDASFARLPQYNVGPYDPTSNPHGFDEDGHRVNLMPLAKDGAIVARYGGDMAAAAAASAEEAAERVEEIRDVIEAIQEGPVVSVNGQTGAVVIDLSELEASVQAKINEVNEDIAAFVGIASEKADLAGATFTGRVTLQAGDLGTNNGAANFANRNVYNLAQSAAMTLTVSNLPDGQDGQVNLSYTAGALSFAGVDRWVVGNDEVATAFSATTVGATGLVAAGIYQFVFSRAGGITVGRVGRVK